MQIKIEEIAAKNLINFYPSQPLAEENTAVYSDKKTSVNIDFLQNVISLPHVEYCLLTDTLVAVKYDSPQAKEDVKALVLAEIDDFCAEKKSLISQASDTSDVKLVEALADSLIRPTLNRDNGDMRILCYQDNILEVEFTGHCAGCPYARNTLNNVIVRTLKKYLPSLSDVKLKE